MMMRCAKDCAGRYSYSYFDARNSPQLERDLNQLGKDGFRVLPRALSLPPHLVERDSVEKRSFSYRVAEASDRTLLLCPVRGRTRVCHRAVEECVFRNEYHSIALERFHQLEGNRLPDSKRLR